MGLSGLCLIHCLATPIVLLLLPNVSQVFSWPEELHIVAAGLAALACGAAIVPRWKSLNGRQKRIIGGFALAGLACLFGALSVHSETLEAAITVLGSCLLIVAHITNLRAR